MNHIKQIVFFALLGICCSINNMESRKLVNRIVFGDDSLEEKLQFIRVNIEKQQSTLLTLVYVTEYIRQNKLEEYNNKKFLKFFQQSLKITAKPHRYASADIAGNLAITAHNSILSDQSKKILQEKLDILFQKFNNKRSKKLKKILVREFKNKSDILITSTLMITSLFLIYLY